MSRVSISLQFFGSIDDSAIDALGSKVSDLQTHIAGLEAELTIDRGSVDFDQVQLDGDGKYPVPIG